MAIMKVRKSHETTFESDDSDSSGNELDPSSESDAENEDRLPTPDKEKSGMASVVARILSKDISKSNRVILAKGKTNKEILQDISKRKRQREESEDGILISNAGKVEKRSKHFKEEKKKIWESMARKMPSVLDNPKEVRLRKIATQGMVQLFRCVNEHQKLIQDRLSSVGSSERKKDKVMEEFTKGRFLDLLKGKKAPEKQNGNESGSKWKILQDDYMMGANMKDWDKEHNDDSASDNMTDENDLSMEADDMSEDDD